MKTADFDFHLPADQIAMHPARPRDSARLLVVGVDLRDRFVRELPELLRPSDLLVFNDTKVIPAQLSARRGTAKIEFNLHKRISSNEWAVFAKPAKRLKPGDTLEIADEFSCRVLEKHQDGELVVRFDRSGIDLMTALERFGRMPLPPYIRKRRPVEPIDSKDYQTIYAAHEGAVAAPTAGLHFTPDLMRRIQEKGIASAHVTLHVGAGTFLPVKSENLAEHKMHAEYGELTQEVAGTINQARHEGRRLVAVGTTSLRLLESAADDHGRVRRFVGETSLFITPGYRFRTAELLMTNFHLPKSTLFMLVAAFAGLQRMKAAYAHAIARGYRFYSYGDATLLERAANG